MDLRIQEAEATPSKVCLFDTLDPNTEGTVFDPAEFELDVDTVFVSESDASTWVYNGSSYITKVYEIPDNTPFNLYGTSIDAGGNKTAFIERTGPIFINSATANGNKFAGYFYSRRTSGEGNGVLIRRDENQTSGYGLRVQLSDFSTSGTPSIDQLRVNHDGSLLINDAYTLPNVDGTSNQVLTTDGAGNVTWTTLNSDIPQAQVIYVDSVNGVNSAGRGDINTPFLTPEYALTQINNTATITGSTNTNTTISGISDADNATLEVGMYLSGTGIPFGTIIVAKGNEGSDLNTITISKATTSTLVGTTLTWYKAYTLVLNGDFVATGNWFKDGVSYELGNSNISFGNLTLFSFSTSNYYTLLSIQGGCFSGTHANSKFIVQGTQTSDIEINIKIKSYYSIGTGYQIDLSTAKRFGYFYFECPYFDARFGYVAKLWSSKVTWVGDSYGLLGGIYADGANQSSYTFNLYGNVETPSSIDAIYIARQLRFSVTGNIKGQFNLNSGGGVLNGYVRGTASVFGSSQYFEPTSINGVVYSSVTTSGDSIINFNGGVVGNITHTGGKIVVSGLMGTYNGSGTSYAVLDGSSQQGNQEITSITTSGTCEVLFIGAEYTSTSKYTTLNIGSGTTLIATNKSRVQISSCAGKIILNGEITHVLKSGDITGNLTILNKLYLDRIGVENATNTPTISVSTGTIICNAERIECLKADSLSGLFRKTADTGKLIFKGQPYLKVANGLAPLQILSNTGTAQDVMNFGVVTNCAVGYRLADTFSDTTYGTAYAPNILVGGTTYEDTTYDF